MTVAMRCATMTASKATSTAIAATTTKGFSLTKSNRLLFASCAERSDVRESESQKERDSDSLAHPTNKIDSAYINQLTTEQLDSLEFRLTHHYTLNDNFIVEPDMNTVLSKLLPKMGHLMLYTALLDSIASEIGKLKQPAFVREDANGTISLTKEEKQVKPNYLISPSVAEEATTLAEKYRILSALSVDKKIASLYEMPTEDYDKTITKLVADINDPSFKAIENAQTIFETTQTLYDEMEKNGRINYFWQLASAALVEELYIANQNADKFLSTFDDEAASNVTFRIILVLDAINRLAEYDPEIKPIADAVAPLEVLNATTVDEFKKQLAEAKDNIAAARSALVK